MSWNPFDFGPHPEGGDGPIHPDNQRMLVSLGLIIALSLFFASALPAVLIPAALQKLFVWGALGGVLLAAFRSEPWNAPRLTGWDQAAVLLLLSLLAGFFVDPAAITEFLRQHVPAASGAIAS